MDVVEQSKSPSDKKKYKLLTLANELQVLLISTSDIPHRNGDDFDAFEEEMSEEDDDEDEDDDDAMSEHGGSVFDGDEDDGHGPPSRRAGACLTVGVGSFAEPAELPGLAHYLEHMLFMGSAKYSDENEFEAFLSAHGGFSNGSTDNEVTNYMFEVGPQHLEQALDMFAHFFISPLMKEEAMERELSAIDSEFSQATQNDRIRLQQVLSDSSLASHPYRRFGWGNRKSLKEVPEANNCDVRTAILAFYEQYYSANLMKLVVCGEDSLETLEQWVTASFSAIPNKHVAPLTFASAGKPFGQHVDPSPLLCRIVPIRDIHTLHLNWMLPPIFGLHHQKPADYVASLLGHESEGSVLSLLKQRGWISSLTAGVTDSDGYDCGTYGAKFDVSMKVTLDGLAHWDDIVHVVFQYLGMLAESGLPEWVFDELKALSDISFRFQEESAAIENCENLAQIMQGMFAVPAHDWLRYDLFQGSFQRELVVQLLQSLTPANVRVSLVSQTHGDDHEFQLQAIEEEWFGVKYSKTLIDSAVLARWNDPGRHAQLHLPMPNPFIPHDFTLVTATVATPVCHVSAFGTLWFKPDLVFATPRAHLAVLIHLPSVMQSVQHCVLTELYVKLVRDALTEYAYHASVAELMYSLRVKEGGLELVFGGFNDKLGLLVDIVTKALFSTELKLARFDVVKEEMLRELKNSIVKLSQKAKYLRLQLLERVAFPLPDSLQALEDATLDDLQAFVSSTLWSSRARFSGLAHGNLSLETAKSLCHAVETQLACVTSPLPASELPARYIHQLPNTTCGLRLQAESEHDQDKNTYVEVYYQIGQWTQRTLAYADLLHQLMEEPLFDTLRTKQELGYEVSCTVRITHGILGFGVMVQSSQFDERYITKCIDTFMMDFEEAIRTLSDEHFQDHIAAQVLKKLEPDHNLMESTHRLWYEISSGRMEFDIDERLAEELKSCTKDDMLSYYGQWVLQTPKKLYVHVRGQSSVRPSDTSAITTPEPVDITNLYAFKAELPVYEDHLRLGHAKTSHQTTL